MQVDLFATPSTYVLAQLGSASVPVGSYQQIRLLLVSNSPGATLTNNKCLGLANVFNCVELSDNSFHALLLSSEANTGLKIPPAQILGGRIQLTAGQSPGLSLVRTTGAQHLP